MLTLNQIAVGESAKVTHLPESSALRKQLLSMGFTPNVSVKVVRQAPLGDPIEYTLRGYSVSLRLAEAQLIGVAPVDASCCETDDVQAESCCAPSKGSCC